MPKRDEFGSVFLDVNAGTDLTPAQPRSDTPFRILLLGDFSGRRDRGPFSSRRCEPASIDRDNLDDVLAGMGIELHLGGQQAASGIKMTIRSLEDFHPDRIFEVVEAFSALREMRKKLTNRSPSPEAIAAVKKWAALPAAAPPAPVQSAPATSPTGSLLESLVDAMESSPPQPVTSRDALKSFVKQVVAPVLQPREDPKVPELIARVDAASSELMRAILHDQDFQALEAAWRAIRFLVYGLETNELLKVYLLDISKAELAAELNAPGGVEKSAMYRLLTQHAEPWALVAGNFAFEQSETDIGMLGRLAELMRAVGRRFSPRPSRRQTVLQAGTRCGDPRLLRGSVWRFPASSSGCPMARRRIRQRVSASRKCPARRSTRNTCGATRPSPVRTCLARLSAPMDGTFGPGHPWRWTACHSTYMRMTESAS